jgi:cysteine-rich repeat protein
VLGAMMVRQALFRISCLVISHWLFSADLALALTGNMLVDFENGNENDTVTPSILSAGTRESLGTWETVQGSVSAEASGSTPHLRITSNASFPLNSATIGGVDYTSPGSRGMRATMVENQNNAAKFNFTTPATNLSLGFYFRYNGASINFSPRDVLLMQDENGNFQVLQIYDQGANSKPYFQTHFQSGAGNGNDVPFDRNKWYWVTIFRAPAGGTMRIRFYDPANNHSLVGESVGVVSSNTQACRQIYFGAVKYSFTGQSVDFDNLVINTSGTFPLIPTAGSTPVAACGNSLTDKFEMCDDGNTANGDGCSSICQVEGDGFPVKLYTNNDPPPTPALASLPLLSQVTQHGITWTFSAPARVGRFVNGDYYVVGNVTVNGITPTPTTTNGRHGSMLNINSDGASSGFDDRIASGRYNASRRVYPPITLTAGNSLVSSRSVATVGTLKRVMRPGDNTTSPVASISILTSVSVPQPPDAFRPSYASGTDIIYFSRNLNRNLLPNLAPVGTIPTLAEFEGYFKRPWVDSIFFGFDAPVEYMPDYGREVGYAMSFASLLLTLNFTPEQKEPLLAYLIQYGIDLHGLVRAGHDGWTGWGGHGSGRKFAVMLAATLLNDAGLRSADADFGEDVQTAYVSQIAPAGTYTRTWHSVPQTAMYAGHMGLTGESVNAGWGPYEHLQPSQWTGNKIGESYRRCCTSQSWVGEALAGRLITGLQQNWNHPAFFDYVDRWMNVPDNATDNATMTAGGFTGYSGDFRQGQAYGILTGGGYMPAHYQFADRMWAAYRNATTLPPTSTHPADKNTDSKLTLDEATSYGYCWKSAPAVPVGCPAGAGLDYAVRAGTLWSSSADGSYNFDPAKTCPLCWVTAP